MLAEKLSHSTAKSSLTLWLVRGLILPVLLANLSAALPFVLYPQAYAWAFEVQGSVGEVIVRSIGLLFLMWVAPYAPALLRPARYRVCLIVILVQQSIGLLGETWMYRALPPGHPALRATGLRFIVFDAVGLVLLGAAYGVLHFRLTFDA